MPNIGSSWGNLLCIFLRFLSRSFHLIKRFSAFFIAIWRYFDRNFDWGLWEAIREALIWNQTWHIGPSIIDHLVQFLFLWDLWLLQFDFPEVHNIFVLPLELLHSSFFLLCWNMNALKRLQSVLFWWSLCFYLRIPKIFEFPKTNIAIWFHTRIWEPDTGQ